MQLEYHIGWLEEAIDMKLGNRCCELLKILLKKFQCHFCRTISQQPTALACERP